MAAYGHLQTHTVTFQFKDGSTPYFCLRTGAAAGVVPGGLILKAGTVLQLG